MRIEQLEYLIAIYKYRSMNLAGEQIHVSQQAISAAIAQLEDEFGAQLVVRTKRGSLLTSEGRQLAELAQRFFADCQKLRQKSRLEQPKQITLLMSPYDDARIWSHIILYFYSYYPQIELKRLPLQTPDTKTDLLAHPEAIALTYASDLEIFHWANEITYEILDTHYLYLVTSQASSLPNQKHISINAIKNEKLLFMCSESEPSPIAAVLNQYPRLKANNECLYQQTIESFYRLLAQDEQTAGIIPLTENSMQTFQKLAQTSIASAQFRFLKLSENIAIHFCCAALLPALPEALLDCLRQLSV